MHIRSKDTVVVITGKDKGKEGKVLVASPKTGKVVVEGVAIATKHQKPRQQGVPGGIVKKEAAIDASNVMLVLPEVQEGRSRWLQRAGERHQGSRVQEVRREHRRLMQEETSNGSASLR